jgi:hypothetical protein
VERCFEYAGAVTLVRCDQIGVLDWLEDFLTPSFQVGSASLGAPVSRIRVQAAPGSFSRWRLEAEPTGSGAECFTLDSRSLRWPLARTRGGGEWAFDERSRVAIGVGADERGVRSVELLADAPDPRARMVVMRVLRELASENAVRSGALHLHAAAVAVADRVSLFAGAKQAGKSSLLVHALSQPGTRYVANDRVFAWAGADGATARGMPTIVSLRAGTLEQRRDLRDELASGAWHFASTLEEARARRANGTRHELYKAAKIPGLSPAQFCSLLGVESLAGGRLARIVFPEIDAGCTAEPGFALRRLAPDEAAERLVDRGLLAGGRLAGFLTRFPPPEPMRLRQAARDLAGSVACFSCALGPAAYREPTVWSGLQDANR